MAVVNAISLLSAGWAGAVLAVVVGFVLGRGLTAAVSCWLGERSRFERSIRLLVAVGTVALWWWEVPASGLAARAADGSLFPSDPFATSARWVAHAVFFTLLAAATWIDMRHRVIPDWITVAGVVLGLASSWLLPEPFLPVRWEIERTFAAPAAVPDVLGAFGGLRSLPGPPWLGGSPCPGGLVLVMAIAIAWWFFCTAPFFEMAAGHPSFVREPRNLLLVLGGVGIAGAWFAGGPRFDALQSSLIGLAVAAGLVWAVREGASRAMGREAMGFGDVTLMAMVGAWLGWQPAVLVFFGATFIGLAHGLIGLVLHRDNELPYGPSLCLAAVLLVVAWRPVWDRVGVFFVDPLLLGVVLVAVVVLTAAALSVWQWVRGRT